MGGLAEELDIQSLAGEGIHCHPVASARMRYHRYIHVFKGTLRRHDGFTTSQFFTGRAEDHNAAPQLIHSVAGSHTGGNGTGGYQIMSAGMTDFGQGIVLGEKGNNRLSAAVPTLKSRGQSADAYLYYKSVFFQESRQPG
jgi:hypothetical protein